MSKNTASTGFVVWWWTNNEECCFSLKFFCGKGWEHFDEAHVVCCYAEGQVGLGHGNNERELTRHQGRRWRRTLFDDAYTSPSGRISPATFESASGHDDEGSVKGYLKEYRRSSDWLALPRHILMYLHTCLFDARRSTNVPVVRNLDRSTLSRVCVCRA